MDGVNCWAPRNNPYHRPGPRSARRRLPLLRNPIACPRTAASESPKQPRSAGPPLAEKESVQSPARNSAGPPDSMRLIPRLKANPLDSRSAQRGSAPLSLLALFCLLPASAAVLPVIPGDSARGARIFENEQCIHCHAVNGRGGRIGLDLGRTVSRAYTPAQLASTMWNHAPVMFGAIKAAGIQTPRLSPENAADLF